MAGSLGSLVSLVVRNLFALMLLARPRRSEGLKQQPRPWPRPRRRRPREGV